MSQSGSDGDPAEHIGRYKILSSLAEGAQGTVYLAEQDEPVRRRVALKLFRHTISDDDSVYRFKIERQALARMSHDHIAKVLDSGTSNLGNPYFVMEYVDGKSLTEYCDEARLSIRERLQVFQQVCAAVHHAHQKGVIHRDLKPSNILVREEGNRPTVKIVDFGLARALDEKLISQVLITEDERVLGTPEYMSPEQAGLSRNDVDTRTDIYALGVVLYELLVGRLPFPSSELRRAGLLEMERIIREKPPPRPSTALTSLGENAAPAAMARRTTIEGLRRSIARDLEWITLRCLEKDRRRRYVSVAALSEDIDRHLDGRPVIAAPASQMYHFAKWVGRHQALVVSGVFAFLVLIVAAVVSYGFFREATDARAMYQRLEDLSTVRDLIARADRLFPELPETIDDIEAWVGEADAVLARRPTHAASLADVQAKLAAGASPRLELERVNLELLQEQMEVLEKLLPAVKQRIPEARRIEAATVGSAEVRARWKQVSDDLLADDRFKFEIEPQIGLVPISPDPKSRLWEFGHPRTGTVPERGADGKLKLTSGSGLVFVLVPGDTFWMGSQHSNKSGRNYFEQSGDNENPPHTRDVDAFFVSKYEMTQNQWHRISGKKPSANNPRTFETYANAAALQIDLARAKGLLPVDRVSWDECREFLARADLRIPTEPEWEYAARAGRAGAWPKGVEKSTVTTVANISDATAVRAKLRFRNPHEGTDGFPASAPVDAFPANGFGLHNMLGNVWEWTSTTYSLYGQKAQSEDKVRRGGAFTAEAIQCTHSYRWHTPASSKFMDQGVRPARSIR